jgi:hypothetical protein
MSISYGKKWHKNALNDPSENILLWYGKGKVKLFLCLTKHHAMETYWG